MYSIVIKTNLYSVVALMFLFPQTQVWKTLFYFSNTIQTLIHHQYLIMCNILRHKQLNWTDVLGNR